MNKGKLEVLVGISCSGKSTWAHKQWLKAPETTVIVNRDKVRELLFGFTEGTIKDYYSLPNIGKNEKLVTRYMDTLIHEGLNVNKRVIVDNTHLRSKYIEAFRFWNVETTVNFFPIKLDEALERDANRTRQVGAENIKKQFDSYTTLIKGWLESPIDLTPVIIDNDGSKPNCYVFDIDGCLAEKSGRSPYEWMRVGEDTPIESIVQQNKLIYSGKSSDEKIIIATGRDGICIDETEKWLDKHGIRYDEIYIRAKGDQRPDWVIKKEFAESITKHLYISTWYDDRLQVTRYLRQLGIKVLNVEYNNF